MALVLRSLIELRFWAEYVSTGPEEASRFLAEADTDSVELYESMKKAFPDDVRVVEMPEVKKRVKSKQNEGNEQMLFKLTSKFIHPSSLVLHDMDATILSPVNRQTFAIQVTMMHDINWTE